MLKNLLLLLMIFIGTSSLSAQSWDGGGDGTSWNDSLNWSNDTIPLPGATAFFLDNTSAIVTGTAPNPIRRIVFDTLTTVTLDLDIDFEITGNAVHNMTFSKDANITLGGTTEMRTFNFITGIDRSSLLINSQGATVTVTEQATLNIDTCQNAIRLSKDDVNFTNNGTINIANYVEHGINMIKGNFTNNATINIGTGTEDGDPTSDGINMTVNAIFNNNLGGDITVTKALDDGLEVIGVFNNAGTVSTIAIDTALAAHTGLTIGDPNIEGLMNNMATGIINVDGGIGGSSRGLTILRSGILNNEGTVNVSGGNLGQAFYNLGTLTNEICARINLIESRISNNFAGTIINNGLLTSSWAAAGINNNPTAEGSALNNAFYGYANGNSSFTGGNVDGTDNGQNASSGIVVDAANSCTVADIGIDVPYTWYTDVEGTIEAGTNDANGLLTFNDDVFPISGTQTLYTCFGEDVQLIVENTLGDCTVLVGVDFVSLTDAFTLMPNPAQTYTEIKFGNQYIAEEKNIEVYNAVGQLVHTINLNNAEHYILNTNNLAVGIYTVNLQTEKGMQIERLVIQK